MNTTFCLVLLLISTTYEIDADDPSPDVNSTMAGINTANENTENSTNDLIVSRYATSEPQDLVKNYELDSKANSTVSEEIKTTETTVETSVEGKSGFPENVTEPIDVSHDDEIETTIDIDVKNATTTLELTNKSMDSNGQVHFRHDDHVIDSVEDTTIQNMDITQANHVDPNKIIDMKSRSGINNEPNENNNITSNTRRFDMHNQSVTNLNSNLSTADLLRFDGVNLTQNKLERSGHNTGAVPSNLGPIHNYDQSIINEMLPYYSGTPIEQYSHDKFTNAYPLNKRRSIPNANNYRKIETGVSKDRTSSNGNPGFFNNTHSQFQKPVPPANNQLNFYGQVQPQMSRMANTFVAERTPNLRENYDFNYEKTNSLSVLQSKRMRDQFSIVPGYSIEQTAYKTIPQQNPINDIYKRLLLDQILKNYSTLGIRGSQFPNQGHVLNSIAKVATLNPMVSSTQPITFMPTLVQEQRRQINSRNLYPQYNSPYFNYGDSRYLQG